MLPYVLCIHGDPLSQTRPVKADWCERVLSGGLLSRSLPVLHTTRGKHNTPGIIIIMATVTIVTVTIVTVTIVTVAMATKYSQRISKFFTIYQAEVGVA